MNIRDYVRHTASHLRGGNHETTEVIETVRIEAMLHGAVLSAEQVRRAIRDVKSVQRKGAQIRIKGRRVLA